MLKSTHIYTTHSPFGKIPSSRGKKPNPKEKSHAHHRRKHQSRQHPWSQGIRLNLQGEQFVPITTVVRSTQGIVLAISGSVTRLPTRRKSWTSRCLIHLSNLSFIRLLVEENSVQAPLTRQGHRERGPRPKLEPRVVSGCSAHSQARKFRWPRMSMLPSRLLESIHQVSPPALPPGQVGLFLSPTRAIFQPLWEKPRAEREECLSTSASARGRCALKRIQVGDGSGRHGQNGGAGGAFKQGLSSHLRSTTR